MKREIFLSFIFISFLFSQEFQIDTTGFIRPYRYDQGSPGVVWLDSVFVAAWCNYGVSNISMCRITGNGYLIDSVAIDVTQAGGEDEVNPLIKKGDTLAILIWEPLDGVIIKKDGSIGNHVQFPSQSYMNYYSAKSIAWDGSKFFVALNGYKGGGLQVRITKISPFGNPMDTTTLIKKDNLDYGTTIGFSDSIGIVIWKKYSPKEVWGTIINRNGEIVDSVLINQGEDYYINFPVNYMDSTFMFLFAKDLGTGVNILYFQRLNYLGELVDTFPQLIDTIVGAIGLSVLVPVDSFLYLFWGDYAHRIHMTRIKKDGSIDSIMTVISPPLAKPWIYLGADFNGENFYLTWGDERDTSGHGYPKGSDLYGAIVDTQGMANPPGGSLISYENYMNFNQLKPSISFLNTKFLVAWEDERRLNKDIYYKIFDFEGNPLNEKPYPLANDEQDESFPSIASSEENYLVCWVKNGDIYGEIIDSSGVPSGIEIPICNEENFQFNPSITYSDSIYFTVWEDQRAGGPPEIYGARILNNGTLIDTNGILISTSPGGCFYPEISGIDSIFLVVWEDLRNDNPDIYASRVTKSGIVLDPQGIPVCTLSTYQKYPSVGKLNDKFILIWQDLRNGNDYDLYYARINLNGEVLEENGNPFVYTQNEEISPFIPQGYVPFIMWYRITPTGYEFRGGFIDTTGLLAGENILIPDASFRQNPCIFIRPDSVYFIAYEKRNQDFLFKIYGYMDKFVNVKEILDESHKFISEKMLTITRDKIILPITTFPFNSLTLYIYSQSGRRISKIITKDKILNLRKLNLSSGIYYLKISTHSTFHKIICIR